MKTIDGLVLRIRTTSTNTYLAADYPCANYDRENNTATFKFVYDEDNENTDTTAKRINEGQYYRVQVAFVQDDVIVARHVQRQIVALKIFRIQLAQIAYEV